MSIWEKEFTVEEGLNIQAEQLAGWKKILIPEVYDSLEEYITRENHLATTGNDVRRGVDLDSYIGNYMLGHRF
jgi:hypothetical protein